MKVIKNLYGSTRLIHRKWTRHLQLHVSLNVSICGRFTGRNYENPRCARLYLAFAYLQLLKVSLSALYFSLRFSFSIVKQPPFAS